MLESLTVENYALIDALEINFAPSLNIITGETGAGKSILLGALGLLLGAKNDGAATRDNTKSCVVEGVFNIEKLDLRAQFEANDWDYEDRVIIRRVITAGGKSRAFVGDIPVSLAELKELSTKLIDVHSQHQNQLLSDEIFRIKSLDLLYSGSAELLAEYRESFNRLSQLRGELKRAEEQSALAKRDEEWLRHQVDELVAANLVAGEDKEIEADLMILENAEQINLVMSTLLQRLDGDDDNGILVSLKGSQREMSHVAKSYPAAAEYSERLSGVVAELKDMQSSVIADLERVDIDPDRLSKLSERLGVIYSLCKKHKSENLDELLVARDKYVAQLGLIDNSDENLTQMRRDIEICSAEARLKAEAIAKKRREVAPKFEKTICDTLGRLGMESAHFVVDIADLERLDDMGCNEVAFLFSSVAGKSLLPLDRVASGGEISRVMLALKSLLAKNMQLPTIIFDEIDTGVSGRIADAMGEIMAELSAQMQVIDITHLPQVASKGDSHFVVFKEDGRTNIRKLSAAERVDAIATMLSGSAITAAARAQAEILLGR